MKSKASDRDGLIEKAGNRRVLYLWGIGAKLKLSPTDTLFLSQLIYWWDKRQDWIYKSFPEWERETGLTRRNVEVARKKLAELGILECRKQQGWNTFEYLLDINRLAELLDEKAEAYATPCNMSQGVCHISQGECNMSQVIPDTNTQNKTENFKAIIGDPHSQCFGGSQSNYINGVNCENISETGNIMYEPPENAPQEWEDERWQLAKTIIRVFNGNHRIALTEGLKPVDRETGKYPDFNLLDQRSVPLCQWLNDYCEVNSHSIDPTIFAGIFSLEEYWERKRYTPDEVRLMVLQAPSPEEAKTVADYYNYWKPNNKDTVDTRRKSLKAMLWNWPEEVDKAMEYRRDENYERDSVKTSSIYKKMHREKRKQEKKAGERRELARQRREKWGR